MTPEEYTRWFHKKIKLSSEGVKNPTLGENDHRLLANFINTSKIKSVLEFGTYEGRTTLFFWLHPDIERVKTIDWGRPYPNEKYGSFFRNITTEDKIKLIFCDSQNWKPEEGEYYDLIYIDAGHEYKNVKNDSEIAFKMKPKIIIWHDYSNEKGVKRYIDKIKEEKKIETYNSIAWMVNEK